MYDNFKRKKGTGSLERQKDFIKVLADMIRDKDDGGSLLYFNEKPQKQDNYNISLRDFCAETAMILKDEFNAEITFTENGRITARFSGGQEFSLQIEKKTEQ